MSQFSRQIYQFQTGHSEIRSMEPFQVQKSQKQRLFRSFFLL